MTDHEHCIVCDNLTGKAGRGDDSLYTDGGEGPFCDTCYSEARIEELEAETNRLQTVENAVLDWLRRDRISTAPARRRRKPNETNIND